MEPPIWIIDIHFWANDHAELFQLSRYRYVCRKWGPIRIDYDSDSGEYLLRRRGSTPMKA